MQTIKVPSGKYVVAVSGGVDSITLLDLLSHVRDLQLVVAHYDHGIRQDSNLDAQFVAKIAKKYGLDFYCETGKMGQYASEASARKLRYEFLNNIMTQINARAIITAHHQDDLLETVILNVLRGTGRRGLSSLQSTALLVRPLLSTTKQELIDYANQHKLKWHEDPTNQNAKYTRNYIRHTLIPKMTLDQRAYLLNISKATFELNDTTDQLVSNILQKNLSDHKLDKHWFNTLPHQLSRELLIGWLRSEGITEYDSRRIEQTVVRAKTLPPNRSIDVNADYRLQISNNKLALVSRDR